MKRLALVFVTLLLAGGAAHARPGVAATTVNLRAEPGTTSAVLTKIPAGGRIEVGDCKDDWCAVTYRGQNGYAIATALDTTNRPRRVAGPPVRRPVPGVLPYDPYDDEVIVSGPPVVYAPRPYYGYGYGYGPRFYGGGFYGRGYGYRGYGRRW